MFKWLFSLWSEAQDQLLREELEERINSFKRKNLPLTLKTLKKYIVHSELKETGLLFKENDPYIEAQAQALFWEWKEEGLITELDNFSDATRSWIFAYS